MNAGASRPAGFFRRGVSGGALLPPWRLLYGAPNFFRRRGHIQRLNPERRQRIDDGVEDRRQRADISRLAGALYAERIRLGRHRVVVEVEVAHIGGAGHAVIEERTGDQLSGFVIDDLFAEGLSDALSDSAMDLAFERQCIDDGADIVGDHVFRYFGDAGIRVDLDLDHVTAIGKSRCLGHEGI